MSVDQTSKKEKNTKKVWVFEGEPAPAEQLHFARIAAEVSAMPWHGSQPSHGEEQAPLIGTLQEKRLHATVKRYLCEDVSTHEIPLISILPADERPKGGRKPVADVLAENCIFEVHTGGFYPLRSKIQWYLDNTPYRVTVVHPMAGIKYLSWIDPADGRVASRNKSPRRGRVRDVAKELYWLSDFIGSPRFSIRLLLLEIEEYRLLDGYGKEKKSRASRYERFPTALLGDIMLYEPEDYAFYFLPEDLRNAPFTAAEYAKATGIRGKTTYSMLRLMIKLGILSEGEKIGRSMSFRYL